MFHRAQGWITKPSPAPPGVNFELRSVSCAPLLGMDVCTLLHSQYQRMHQCLEQLELTAASWIPEANGGLIIIKVNKHPCRDHILNTHSVAVHLLLINSFNLNRTR